LLKEALSLPKAKPKTLPGIRTTDWPTLPRIDVQAVRTKSRRWTTIGVPCPQCRRLLDVSVRAFLVRHDGTLESERSLVCADDDHYVPTDGCGATFPVKVRWAGHAG